MKRVFLAAAVATLAGCAVHQPTLTRAEYLQVTQRTYSDKTPEQVFAAAEKLFRLADGNDFTFTWSEDSLFASRQWSIYLVLAASFGTDNWTVRALPDGAGSRVAVAISSSAAPITPIPTTGGQMTAGALPAMGGSMQGTAIYDVFWSRLDYLLGKRDHWMTCDEANSRVSSKTTWGGNSPLCNSFNLKDENPETPTVAGK